MSVLPDHWIEEMARRHAMIEPFAENRRRPGKISYGVSSYGYDFRLADTYKIPEFSGVKHWIPKGWTKFVSRMSQASRATFPANSFILGRSLEYFRIPRNVLVLCQGKSTYARCGLVVNVTTV